MKRSWNWRVWVGFAVALFAAVSYIPLFTRFAATRDIPWVNLLLFVPAGYLLASGTRRAFRQSDRYRGKISGRILSALSLALFGLFSFGIFYAARSLPSGASALRVGQLAPDFQLADSEGRVITLSQIRQGKGPVLLVFYRGYW